MSQTPEDQQGAAADEQDWPTHCESCGTEFESAVVDLAPDADAAHLQTGSPASVVRQDYCPNPDCPANKP